MDKELIGKYVNGNHTTRIFYDGTRIRETIDPKCDEFTFEFPESIDLKITDRCDMMCPMCHESSTKDGSHADLNGLKFLDTLRPYTEVAIGGGNPLCHPRLEEFLLKMKDQKVICNMTVNYNHFVKYKEYVRILLKVGFIHGIGVSVGNTVDVDTEQFEGFTNLVVHVINGVIEEECWNNLKGKGLKILILGYKNIGRGEEYLYNGVMERRKFMENEVEYLLKNKGEIVDPFNSVSFDNLAIEQLNVRDNFGKVAWSVLYQGDDGIHSMYVDGVRGECSISSFSKDRYAVRSDIVDMFKEVKNIVD